MKNDLKVKIILSVNFDSKEIMLLCHHFTNDAGIYHFFEANKPVAILSINANDCYVLTELLVIR
jgi:hypothetical protein